MNAPVLEVPDILDDATNDLSNMAEQLAQARLMPLEIAFDTVLSLLFRHNRSAMTLLERQRGLQNFSDEYRHYLNQDGLTPLPVKTLIRLCNELAYGYKHLLLSMLKGRQPSIQHMSWCIFSALYFISQSILRQYQLYQEPHPTQWHDSHQLYWLAERYQCLDEPVSSAFIPQPANSLRGLYQQLLLLALSNPFHLNEGEIEHLFCALAGYASLPKLISWDTEDDTSGLVIDLNSSMAFQTPENAHPFSTDSLRRFDIGALQVALDDPLPLQSQVEQQVLQKVQHHWLGRQQRRHERIEQNGSTCEVVVGINAIHAQLLEHRPEHLNVRILDGSAGGLRLLCRPELAPQFPVGQLVLLVANQTSPTLALIRWRHQNSQGLHLGLRYLKGLPRAAWVRRAPSAQTHPGIMQSTPVSGGGWHHGLWLAHGQFVESENLWLQLHNSNSQTIVQLPPSNLASTSVARHPLRQA